MTEENSTDEINVDIAFLRAQQEMLDPGKNKKNPAFSKNSPIPYADLNSVIAAIREPLTNHGLSFSQNIVCEDGKNQLRASIIHAESGTTLRFGPFFIPCIDDRDPQKFKMGVTYMRRTQILAIFNLGDADDDGNEASQPKKTKTKPKKAPPGASEPPPKPSERDTMGKVTKITKNTPERLQFNIKDSSGTDCAVQVNTPAALEWIAEEFEIRILGTAVKKSKSKGNGHYYLYVDPEIEQADDIKF